MVGTIEGIKEILVGKRLKSRRRTFSEGDYAMMVNVSWENSHLHTDQEYMKTTKFGERILGGPCIVPLVAGLTGMSTHELWETVGLRTVALVGIDNVRFTAPMHPGDTIWLEIEITDFRPTSRPKRYIVRWQDVLFKQTGEQVLQMERTELLEEISKPKAQVAAPKAKLSKRLKISKK